MSEFHQQQMKKVQIKVGQMKDEKQNHNLRLRKRDRSRWRFTKKVEKVDGGWKKKNREGTVWYESGLSEMDLLKRSTYLTITIDYLKQ